MSAEALDRARATPAAPAVNGRLVRLADYVEVHDTAPLAGDATLVLRTERYPNGTSYSGADLYGDNGQYFYAPTEAGLPAAIAAGPQPGTGIFARDVKAAEEAAGGDVATATQAMAYAAYPGSTPPTPAEQAQASAKVTASIAKLRAEGRALPLPNPSFSGSLSKGLLDNRVWENSLDALRAGAGNPQVRIGVLRILSTLPEVTVTDTTTSGQPTLTLTAAAPALPANYQEQLVLDATTGVPVSLAGGTVGQAPSVTVSYQVSRVTLADVQAGRF